MKILSADDSAISAVIKTRDVLGYVSWKQRTVGRRWKLWKRNTRCRAYPARLEYAALNGLEVLKKLKADGRFKAIPVMM